MWPNDTKGQFSLQAVLSSTTSGMATSVLPHHPIACTGSLSFDADGVFGCEHVKVPADDERTQACLNHSLACLLIEFASAL